MQSLQSGCKRVLLEARERSAAVPRNFGHRSAYRGRRLAVLKRRTRFREERLIGVALAAAAAAYAFALFGLPFHGTSSASAGYCGGGYQCPPATLTLTPEAGINDVATSHTVTATVTDTLGDPVQGIAVRFSVTGSVTTSGSCTTNSAGQCTFTYAGPPVPGADLISAYADSNNNNVEDPGEPADIATKAWVPPGSLTGHVTGGGQIMPGGNRVAFGFSAKSNGGLRGECSVVDQAAERHIKCTDATALVVAGNEAWIYGNARDEGAPTSYLIHVVDVADPGRGRDTFSITTASGYSAGGTLTGGNIQVHS